VNLNNSVETHPALLGLFSHIWMIPDINWSRRKRSFSYETDSWGTMRSWIIRATAFAWLAVNGRSAGLEQITYL